MSGLAGTWPLVRLALRLDRARLAAWVGALLLVVVATAIGFGELYPDAASRRQLAAGIGSNPALLAMYGRLEAESVGGLTVWRQGAFQLVLVALMSLLTVVRHTRAAEETGRIELVGAAAIGRRAPLAAAVGTASLGSTAIGLTVAVGMVAVGQDAAGSIAFGAALAATGWAFAGVA
ncbi:MAG: ABC transporter permease, partial [Actinomycetota bacterium]|nr:ABC transporter permease [Actinomycetota bacterium]